jgi:hypothetical protein
VRYLRLLVGSECENIMKIEERSSLLPTKPDPTGSQIG